MRRVTGDEHASDAVFLGHRHTQVPETDVIKLASEREARRLVQQTKEVEVAGGGVQGHRRVEKPAFTNIDTAEKLPVAFQIRVHDVIGGLDREALQPLVQFARPEYRQHHFLVKVGAAAAYAGLLTNDGAAAVAADNVVGLQDPALAALARHNPDTHALSVLLDGLRIPAKERRHEGQCRHSMAQHFLGLVLGQALIGLEVIFVYQLTLRRRSPVFTHQAAVGADAAGGHALRHEARGAQRVDTVPEIKMLQRALGEVLPLRDALHQDVALDQRATDPALPKLDRERDADRPATDDDHLISVLFHGCLGCCDVHFPLPACGVTGVGAGFGTSFGALNAHDVIRRQFRHRGAAHQRHHPLGFVAQDGQRPGSTGLATCRDAEQGGAAQQHGVST